jgi:hypothetical protein
MRAIQYNTHQEALDAWEELEQKCLNYHKPGTLKFTYVIDNVLLVPAKVGYNKALNSFLNGKETFEYEFPQTEENF